MNNNELKPVTIGGREFSIVKLDPWKRLAFIADFQKEFLAPALKNLGGTDVKSMFGGEGQNNFDVIALVSAFSNLIDGNRLEYWTKRILAEGLIIYTREDGQRAKLAFSELTKIFTSPADIIVLLKDVIVFNMDDIGGLMNNFAKTNSAAGKVNIIENS